MDIQNPHDKFFKAIQSNRKNAADFIQALFPGNISANIDFDSLKLEKDSYIDTELSEYFSDLVYSCHYRADTLIKIAILFEHKSFIPECPYVQLLQYWSNIIKQYKKPPFKIVIPFVFYHGKENWEKRSFYDYFGRVPEELKGFIPAFDYIFSTTRDHDDEEIRNKLFKQKLNTLMMFLMKHMFEDEYLLKHLSVLEELLREQAENNEDLLISIFLYLFSILSTEKEHVIQEIIKIPGGKKAMTILEQVKTEGIEQKAEDAAIKMLEEKIALDVIQRVTGLSMERIQALREKQEK